MAGVTAMQRIANVIGWIGTVLVFGAVIARFAKPEWDQYAIYAAWAGLACLVLYVLGQWRDILDFFQRRQARYGALASASVPWREPIPASLRAPAPSRLKATAASRPSSTRPSLKSRSCRIPRARG